MQRPPRKESTTSGPLTDPLGVHATSAVTRDMPNAVRRNVLHGMLATVAATLFGSASMLALAQTPTTSPDAVLDTFMRLSNALTARTTLDRTVGTRLLAAVAHGQPAFEAALPGLAAGLAAGHLNAEQQQLAWRIMEGWYLGIVDNVVITYEQALMFDVVYDTPVIRSYAPGKPGFWAQKPIEKNA